MMAEINFVVLKINGTDISQLPEDKVVQMFLTAGEPLLVEMHRRPSPTPNCGIIASTVSPDYNENDCDDVNAKLAELKITPPMKPITGESVKIDDADLTSTIKLVVAIKSSEPTTMAENGLSHARKSTQTDNSYFIYDNSKNTAEHFIEHEHNLLEQCLAPEIDIEEITLRKSDSNERLGLIVCYNGSVNNGTSSENNGALSSSDDNDACTEVYISGIQPDSVAGRDGRLRQGDQILQINGKDIKNKEETELLIAENNNADEDDFNDPLLADLEVEDEDDIDDEEYYVGSTITYENCLLQNDPANELEKALALHSENKTKKQQQATPIEDRSSVTSTFTNADAIVTCSNSIETSVHTGSPEQKSALLSSLSKDFTSAARSEKVLSQIPSQPTPQQNIRKIHQHLAKKHIHSYKADQPAWTLPAPLGSLKNDWNERRHINYDTEHIYETIPEDSESEPVYCSPYESSTYVTALGSGSSTATDSLQLQQQKKNVAKWLDVCPNPMTMPQNVKNNVLAVSMDNARSNSGCNRKQLHIGTNEAIIRKKTNTARSSLTIITNGSSSSGGSGNSGTSNIADVLQSEERDYSSSAYNTGGSNNSTIPLSSVLNPNSKCTGILEDCCRLQKPLLSKDKTSCVSSKAGSDGMPPFSQTLRNNIDGASDVRPNQTVNQTFEDANRFSTNHLYNNDPVQSQLNQKSMCREMVSKKHLHPVLTQDQLIHHQNLCCPQFVAPNLSQYHFVSSQEVRTGFHQTTPVPSYSVDTVGNRKTLSKDDTMVWKVKRRQDGTRYIVRRPARNRCILRDRSIRINTEQVRNRDISTTTEEDNISEVKAGRYWSKEERRKHIERARERKQQHQQVIDDTNISKACLRDQSLKLYQQKRDELFHQQRSNQHRFTEHSGTQIQQGNVAAPLQQHYQLQFNSSRLQHPKHTRIVGGCDSNGSNCGSSSTKEPALETNEIETCRISTPLTEITPIINKSSGDGVPSSLVVPILQNAVATNTSTFPISAERSELQNLISITTI